MGKTACSGLVELKVVAEWIDNDNDGYGGDDEDLSPCAQAPTSNESSINEKCEWQDNLCVEDMRERGDCKVQTRKEC